MNASAQSLDFLELAKNHTLLNWKPARAMKLMFELEL
jgi:hypothetical protein